tara:strand:- start:1568 stop:1789 length:222 start_codon:yes stop_codon:yes gene_type:complete
MKVQTILRPFMFSWICFASLILDNVFSNMRFTFVQIFWIILIVIALVSIKRIVSKKGWTLKNFIRVEEVDDDA